MKISTRTCFRGSAACALAFVAMPFLSLPGGFAKGSSASEETPERVMLERRTEPGAYGKSAYSFRYASQSKEEHYDEVDLVFNDCGNLHVAIGSANNQVIEVEAKTLEDVEEVPEEGWARQCFVPKERSIYVMQIDDERSRFTVKFRILDVKKDRVLFEWLPFTEAPRTLRGPFKVCGAEHACY